ncbi:Rrf2 family transcriptional regulator [Acinetobacter bohemicus]|uniref:Rrf2 family transcriptional regulator n=1 Tax=Acinetobacter lwoffii TaxID=28090 RepID=A0A9D2UQI4_ACILW|nr:MULTISPECIES: Rrf2 family transcriptional regulator [Acinetobacter]HJF26874.1 Rrf2 family transcriptional regulator [Acinetobacter lwoffii]MCO8041259.1 Rrf2 family transcriptional regulator [Acinetobacter sp. S4400-12]MCO8043956.1 Rrf2 family transcriptional regulator [Acinetobacter sp. S4397-1]MCU7223428.1 Rrf2 family transcriptional regulator [Acinetobacter bohemicus]QKQ70881.1 Rrf2 family transcriptional regulator [Acinetobacter sp. 10FS3-1]
MQLNKFTDYALRILMYVAQPRDLPYTIAELAERLEVSQNHAMKIVHFMAKQNWLITTRGKGGGVRLNPDTLKLQLGQIVRILQRDNQIVECNDPPCVLRYGCGLKGILDQAMEQFYASLDQYILGDVIQPVQGHFSLQSPINLINL